MYLIAVVLFQPSAELKEMMFREAVESSGSDSSDHRRKARKKKSHHSRHRSSHSTKKKGKKKKKRRSPSTSATDSSGSDSDSPHSSRRVSNSKKMKKKRSSSSAGRPKPVFYPKYQRSVDSVNHVPNAPRKSDARRSDHNVDMTETPLIRRPLHPRSLVLNGDDLADIPITHPIRQDFALVSYDYFFRLLLHRSVHVFYISFLIISYYTVPYSNHTVCYYTVIIIIIFLGTIDIPFGE